MSHTSDQAGPSRKCEPDLGVVWRLERRSAPPKASPGSSAKAQRHSRRAKKFCRLTKMRWRKRLGADFTGAFGVRKDNVSIKYSGLASKFERASFATVLVSTTHDDCPTFDQRFDPENNT